MARYFTSDLHLGSSLINEYARRPFFTAEEALRNHIAAIEKTLTDENDILIHVGDFALRGSDRHGKTEDRGLDHSLKDYLGMIRRRVVLLAGNHDDGHSFEADCKSMVLDLNHNWRNVYVNHFPSDHKDYHGLTGSGGRIQINLCGHVHNSWLLKFDAKKRVLNVNVSTDVWGYRPVRDAELTELLDFVTGKKIDKTGYDFSTGFVESREDYDAFVKIVKWGVKHDRENRRAAKLRKKGLTPEECERRKIEAMKKKGLIKYRSGENEAAVMT